MNSTNKHIRTVFVVENEVALREFFCEVVQMFGYRVIEASSGAAALPIWNKHKNNIDLLLTDVLMPGGVNGFELARSLQSDKPKLKVIYCTGSETYGLAPDLVLEEDVNLLPKPFRMEKLAKILHDNFESAEMDEQGSAMRRCVVAC